MSLQSQIDEHLKDQRLSRRVISLQGLSGECSLPANVRLHFQDCGTITITSADGNNEIHYEDGPGITVRNTVNSKIFIRNAEKATLTEVSECEITLSDCRLTKDLAVRGSSLSIKSCESDAKLVAVDCWGAIVDVNSTHTATFTNCSDLTLDNLSFSEPVSFVDCTVLIGSSIFQQIISFMSCKVTLKSCTFEQTVIFGSCQLIDSNSTYMMETLVQGGEETFKNTTHSLSLSHSNGRLKLDNVSVAISLTVNAGSLYANKVNVGSSSTVSEGNSILKDFSTESLSASAGSHVWENVQVSTGAMNMNCTLESRNCSYGSYHRVDGGSFYKHGDKEETFEAQNVVGRNKLIKGEDSDLILVGAGSRLEIAETKVSGNALLEGFRKAETDQLEVTGDLTLKQLRLFELLGDTVGGLIKIQDCRSGLVSDMSGKDLDITGSGRLDFDEVNLSGKVSVGKSAGGTDWGQQQ